ncbi:MAG TPA: chitobiase/beta-hexosaminidase C-terminal domain-containing protein, partial [Methanocella sp.]
NTSVRIAFSAIDPVSGTWFTRYNISDSATPPDNGTDSYWSNYTISVGYSTAGIHYLHYYSVDNANNTETTKSSAIKIDKQAPVTSFALTGTHTARSDWNNTAVGITLSAVDAGGSGNKYTRYMLTTSPTPPLLTDSGWTNYAGTFTYAVEGTHYLYFYSMDYALNNETIVACPCPIRIDTSAPPTTTAIISGDLPAREWNNTSVRIAFSAIDPVSGTWFTRYNISDSATPPDNGTDSYWSNYTIPVDYSTAGIHYLHYYSVDNANNTETTKSSAIKIDKQAPVTSFALTGTHPAGSDWNSTGVGITLTAVDAGGSNNKYTRYMFTDSLTPPLLTDSGWSTYGGTFTYSVEGTHYLHFYSMDYALNNETIVTCPCPIRVDMGAPTIPQPVISGVRGTNGWNTTLVTITFNPSSTTSGINNSWYRYYYQDTTPLNRPANTSGNVINVPSDGNYTVEFYTDSNSGNLASARLNIKIDTFAPVTSNTTLSGTQGTNGWYITPVSFDIGASDASGIAEASGVKNMTYVFNHTGVANTSVLKQASALPWHITEATEGISCYYFYSWDNAGNNGTLRNLTIKIDTKEPTTASTINGIPGKNGWNITNVSMFLTPTDSPGTVISATYYRINGQGADPFTLYTGPVTISDERNSTVEYYSVDEAGKEEMVNARNVLIDRTKPTTTIILNGSEGISGWFNSSVIINLTATDNANGSGVNSTNLSSTNINSFTRYDGNVTISSEGITTIYYYSTDNASNPEIIHSQAIKIDKSAPVTTNSTIGALDPDGWYTSDVSVMLTPTDTGGSGSKSTWYRVNGGTYLLYAPFQLTTEGNNTVEFFSTDNAGNNETPQRMQIKIGKSLPHTICTLSGTTNGNGAYTSDVSVNLTATEDGPGIDYLCYNLNGGLFTTVAGNNTTFKLTGGTYVIKYFAVDRIGRHESTNNTTVTIDRIAPVTTASLNRTATNGWYTSDVNVTLTATDSGIGVDFVRYSTNGGGYTVIPSGTTLTIVDNGTTTIRYYAVDKAGNSENIANCVVKIDKAPPTMSARVLSGTLLGDTSWYTTNVTVELSAADSVSGPARIVYNVSGSGDNTIAGNVYYVPVTLEGNVTIWFHAIDNAGNAGAPQSFNLSVDRNPLTTNCTLTGTKGNNDWYSTKVTVNLTAGDRLSEVNYTEYSFDNVNWINYTGPFEYGLNGIGTIYYHSKDIQGYVEPIRTRQLKIDLTDPQAICTLSGTQNAQGRFTSDVTVSLSGSDQSGIVQIQSSYDGSTWEMYTGPFVVPNGSSKLILYRAWDNAGRVGGNQTWIFFVNDAGQPTPTPTPTPTPGPDQIATITPEPTATPTPGPTGTPTTGPPPTPTEITSVPGFTVMAAFAALAGAMAIAVRNRQGRKK